MIRPSKNLRTSQLRNKYVHTTFQRVALFQRAFGALVQTPALRQQNQHTLVAAPADNGFACNSRILDTHARLSRCQHDNMSLARNEENARSVFYHRHKVPVAYSFWRKVFKNFVHKCAIMLPCSVQFLVIYNQIYPPQASSLRPNYPWLMWCQCQKTRVVSAVGVGCLGLFLSPPLLKSDESARASYEPCMQNSTRINTTQRDLLYGLLYGCVNF